MEWIRNYLISIVAAAVICSVITTFLCRKDGISSIIKLLAGLFMAITVISPWRSLDINGFIASNDSTTGEIEQWIANGEMYADNQIRGIIKEQTEAYILDKAASLGLEVQVSVVLSETGDPVPVSVSISGLTSPYAKNLLSQYIADEIGVAKEYQVWN